MMLMRYSDSPDQSQCNPARLDKVMHSSFRVGDTVLSASDGHGDGEASFEGISLTINAESDEEAERLFAALSDGGQITVPLAKTFFASSFGMLQDRFGVGWMVLKATM